MTGKKIVYLFIALLLPIAVFLFLKFFGKNEFAVTPLFQSEKELPSGNCAYSYDVPYTIPDSVFSLLRIQSRSELVVVIFAAASAGEEDDRLVNRVQDGFLYDPVEFRWISEDTSAVRWDLIRRCVFLLPDGINVVALDRKGRIRGQYDGHSLEEMDRLTVELKVILRKY